MNKLTRFYYTENEDNQSKLRIEKIDTGISIIGKNAFENDGTVQKLILPVSVNCIEEKAFKNCKELHVVEFGTANNPHYSVEKIGEESNDNNASDKEEKRLVIQYQAFKDCSKLHTIILPVVEKLVIEKEAFLGCSSLRTVVIPNVISEVEISPDAFYGLDGIVFVTNNESVQRFAREQEFRCVKG